MNGKDHAGNGQEAPKWLKPKLYGQRAENESEPRFEIQSHRNGRQIPIGRHPSTAVNRSREQAASRKRSQN